MLETNKSKGGIIYASFLPTNTVKRDLETSINICFYHNLLEKLKKSLNAKETKIL